MRVALSAVASVLYAGFFLSESRQASERQEHARMSRCAIATCPELEVADLDCEFPLLGGLGTGVIVSLAFVVILRDMCSTGAKPSALRVRRVRLNHREDVGFEGSYEGLGSSCRIQVSWIGSLRRSLVGPLVTGCVG